MEIQHGHDLSANEAQIVFRRHRKRILQQYVEEEFKPRPRRTGSGTSTSCSSPKRTRIVILTQGTRPGPAVDLHGLPPEADVDIQVGSGFLNYINGYVIKASDCVDFSAKEYSDQDGEGAENTYWKRTYRGLLKGTHPRS